MAFYLMVLVSFDYYLVYIRGVGRPQAPELASLILIPRTACFRHLDRALFTEYK